MSKWYVIQTKPHNEERVHRILSRAGLESFLPKIREICYVKNVTHFRHKPLFPSYLFLHIDFDNSHNFHLIKYTRGVSKILCADNKPLPVAEEIVDTIKARVNPANVVEHPFQLKAGDNIRVKRGLLKDLIGVLEKPSSAEERIFVLLKLANYDMKARLHWTEVEKLHAA